MVARAVRLLPHVEADSFEGLLVEYVERRSAQAVIRGLRAVSDFEFEFQLALMNRTLNERIETIFMMPKDTLHSSVRGWSKKLRCWAGMSARLCWRTCGPPWPGNLSHKPA